MPEAVCQALLELTTGQDGDADRIEQAILIALERKMTVETAKKLVQWVRAGNTPESFPQDGKIKTKKGTKQQNYDLNDPLAEKCGIRSKEPDFTFEKNHEFRSKEPLSRPSLIKCG